jgi:hypothetical protein
MNKFPVKQAMLLLLLFLRLAGAVELNSAEMRNSINKCMRVAHLGFE